MGREIRRVPPDWQHPTKDCDCLSYGRLRHSEYDLPGHRQYVPLYDKDYATARAEWIEGFRHWDMGEVKDYKGGWRPKPADETDDYWEYDGPPPEREMYHPTWTAEQATAYQVYETVSEGTPISPVLPTRDALLDWLMYDGYGMGIEPRTLRLTREQAERFIEAGSAPSLVADAVHGVRDGVVAL